MAAFCELNSAGLIEKDENGDVLWAWSYPRLTNIQREVYCKTCCLKQGKQTQVVEFVYNNFQNSWYYIYTTDASGCSLKSVSHFSIVLVSQDFNPERYMELCKLLSKLYGRSGNPALMLDSYLSVVTKGACNGEENGSYAVKDFDQRQAFTAGSLKDVINKFQIEVILIYTAMLLKKRIAVYHSVLQELLQLVRVFPAFVWHRRNWNVLYPFVQLNNDVELQNLKRTSHYVAGFTQSEIENRSDLYDIFVNATTGEISVAPHAKEFFSLGKLHKEIAMLMLEGAGDESKSEQQVIKDIALKTKELLNNLQGLCVEEENGKYSLTIETLRQRKMQPATETFLFSLASAEGMVKT